MKRTIGNQRLLKLAALLERLPPERFNYSHWVGDDWKGKKDLSCGTTACALGWATTIPELRKLGLHLRKDSEGYADVVCGRMENKFAGMKVFGLTFEESEALFTGASLRKDGKYALGATDPAALLLGLCPSMDESAAVVAARIRTLVAWKESRPRQKKVTT